MYGGSVACSSSIAHCRCCRRSSIVRIAMCERPSSDGKPWAAEDSRAPGALSRGSKSELSSAGFGAMLDRCPRRSPGDAVAWGGTAEGDGTSYGPDGSLIGMTILNAKLRLEEDGKIQLTLPAHR